MVTYLNLREGLEVHIRCGRLGSSHTDYLEITFRWSVTARRVVLYQTTSFSRFPRQSWWYTCFVVPVQPSLRYGALV